MLVQIASRYISCTLEPAKYTPAHGPSKVPKGAHPSRLISIFWGLCLLLVADGVHHVALLLVRSSRGDLLEVEVYHA